MQTFLKPFIKLTGLHRSCFTVLGFSSFFKWYFEQVNEVIEKA